MPIAITNLPDTYYDEFKRQKMTEPRTCYNNCLRATLFSKSEKVASKFNYVAGWVTDQNGIRVEHAFLHTKHKDANYYFDPTLQNDLNIAAYKYEIGKIFSIENLESMLILCESKENIQQMRDGLMQWPDIRYVNGKYNFQ